MRTPPPQLLDQAGFDVAVARTGAEALTLVGEAGPDLVTLDLTLPDIDGGLIGGASLDPGDFAALVQTAARLVATA